MSNDLGKKFEQKFKEDWKKSFPNSFIYRLHDQVSGFIVTSANPCDFICFVDGKLFLIELKSHEGASLPFDVVRQYDLLKQYKGISGVYPVVIFWLKDKDKVYCLPIQEMEKMVNDNKKSINPQKIDNKYTVYEIPSVKKRVFMDSDYKQLLNIVQDIDINEVKQ